MGPNHARLQPVSVVGTRVEPPVTSLARDGRAAVLVSHGLGVRTTIETDPKTNRTMIWDNECRMVNDPEGEARKILLAWS
jgi:hypothetical protein